MTLVERLRRLLPAVWLGCCCAWPSSPRRRPLRCCRADAGRINGRVFLHEAWVGIGLALLLWLVERARARLRAVRAGQGSMLSTEMVLLVGCCCAPSVATSRSSRCCRPRAPGRRR
jgi:hypothetical protein